MTVNLLGFQFVSVCCTKSITSSVVDIQDSEASTCKVLDDKADRIGAVACEQTAYPVYCKIKYKVECSSAK